MSESLRGTWNLYVEQQTTITKETNYYCRSIGKQCANATDLGYCKLTVCTNRERILFKGRTEGRMSDNYRELFTDDLIDLNEILDALSGAGPELKERVVITRLAQTLKHVLVYAMRGEEKHDRT